MKTPDHPDFTALALGEHIHGTPARAVLDALRTSVAARQEAQQIRDSAARLSFVLQAQPPQRLDSKRRNAIYNADIAAVRARFAAEERAEEEILIAPPVVRRPRTWIYPLAAAAAVVAAAVAVLHFLAGSAAPSPEAGTPVAREDADLNGSILVSPADPAAPRVHQPRVPVVPGVARQEPIAPLPQDAPVESPAPAAPPELVKPAPAVKEAPLPEPPRTRPPYRPDHRDWVAPERVKER